MNPPQRWLAILVLATGCTGAHLKEAEGTALEACNVPPGIPVAAPAGAATWVPVAESRCMNGSSTGFGLLNASAQSPNRDKLLIYLEPGGAAYDEVSYANVAHKEGFSASDFVSLVTLARQLRLTLFDPTSPVNPFADWNIAFVPYCSGDVHAGQTDAGFQPAGQVPLMQQGYRNLQFDLQRLAASFPDLSHIVLAGSSAGGFGATLNFTQVRAAFCHVPLVDLVNDAGPALTDDYLPACLQSKWRNTWNLDASLPQDCAACRQSDGGGLVNLTTYLAQHHPQSRFAFLSSLEDEVMRGYFGFADGTCARLPQGMPAARFREGILKVRDTVLDAIGPEAGDWATFYVPGNQHPLLLSSTPGQSLDAAIGAWLEQMISRAPWDDVQQ